jgi:hypothetical protein
MTEKEGLFWFIGLFEGEGSFSMTQKYAKNITITSTDLDVLEKVKELFGGIIITPKKRNDKWKQEYVWYTNKHDSRKLIELIYPYLSHRRKGRADEWVALYNINVNKTNKTQSIRKENVNTIISLRKEGLTHQAISEKIGYDRSSVSKILKRLGLNMVV